ncbi:cytochrome c/FTR1 family iron permease [Bowmanella denitrificans]|uniref:Cytochrome c/FTR1 family iron permease n=1 Tax=Bowmanella denitrificans TaxID=366582 RepID=A0ABN0XFX4_9ALTE
MKRFNWALTLLFFGLTAHLAQASGPGPERILHLLSYVGVDYPMTVADGQIVDQGEYVEQVEFAEAVEQILQNLPATVQSPQLLEDSRTLKRLIDERRPGQEIKAMTAKLSEAVTKAYDIKLAPRGTPEPLSVANLYQQMCSACHGATGLGDGIAGAGMEPAPANFHDTERMNELTLFGLYNTITLGVEGTGMASYANLSESQRWSLAAFVAGYVTERPQGKVTSPFNLDQLATLTPVQVQAQGQNVEQFVQLRAHPDVIESDKPAPLVFAKQTLAQSWQAVEAGDFEQAYQLSIGAYLEGFELVEASLDNLDKALRKDIELAMFAYRDGLRDRLSLDELQGRYNRAQSALDQAQILLDEGGLSPLLSFIASLIILLREGLEAILVLAAIFAFLKRSGATSSLKYVHSGWIAALVCGLATWAVASYLFNISGASRELTEGMTALLATAILLWVGIWMHSKAHASNWQQYIKDKLSASLSSGQNIGFAVLAFVAVYREIFEIILFYQALWLQAGPEGQQAVIFGMLAAAVLLVVLSVVIFKLAMRVPVGMFFKVNAAIMFALAVIFAGRGIAALQETGSIVSIPLNLPEATWLGIYADGVTLMSQAVLIALIALMTVYQRKARI